MKRILKSVFIIAIAVAVWFALMFVWSESISSNSQENYETEYEDSIRENCNKLHNGDSQKTEKCYDTISGKNIEPMEIPKPETLVPTITDTCKNSDNCATLMINSNTAWNLVFSDGKMSTYSLDGNGNESIQIQCGNYPISLNVQNQKDYGEIELRLIQDGEILSNAYTNSAYGIAGLASECQWKLLGYD